MEGHNFSLVKHHSRSLDPHHSSSHSLGKRHAHSPLDQRSKVHDRTYV